MMHNLDHSLKWISRQAEFVSVVAKKDKFSTGVIIESDAKNLIDKFFTGCFDDDTGTDGIFKDIQFFSLKFVDVDCIFSFQPRLCNWHPVLFFKICRRRL